MSLRGQAAIVGFAELPSTRALTGRTSKSLLAEVATQAIRDAGLLKRDIDGICTRDVHPLTLAEYMQIMPTFAETVEVHGASGAFSVVQAAMAINAGLATNVLCVFGGTRDQNLGGGAPGEGGPVGARGTGSEWEAIFGPVIAANGGYGLIKQRHMYQYGTTQEQFAKMMVNQRFNALENPNAVFKGQPITLEDVLNSRFVNDPLHLLECVMPCDGGGAVIVTSAERARSLPNPPVYVLGMGGAATIRDSIVYGQERDITLTAVAKTAPLALRMSGYSPKDMQMAQFYD